MFHVLHQPSRLSYFVPDKLLEPVWTCHPSFHKAAHERTNRSSSDFLIVGSSPYRTIVLVTVNGRGRGPPHFARFPA